MNGVIEVPIWLAALGGLAAAVAIVDRVIGPSMRWYLRRRMIRAVDDLNQRLSLKIQPFKLMRRQTLISRLSHDPTVMHAAEEHAAETGIPRDIVHEQVAAYAREIVPGFSADMYFGVGARLSRWIGKSLYRVRLGAFDRDGLTEVDSDAAIVFVMNHRSNVDYLLVTYLASESSALSYAVGEWARVWPLSRVIRAMGAYFVRRRSRDALYRSVLRRYVQMSIEGGVTQAVFPEGGLSRDGRLGEPKLGLLSYMIDGFDPDAGRDVIFVPVGLNYDRVLEDRLLLAARGEPEAGGGKERPRFNVSALTVMGFLGGYVLGRLTGRAHRFGYACVSFGAPLSLKRFMGAAPPGEAVARLGEELSDRIGAVVPILPVSLVASVLCAAEGPVARDELMERVAKLATELEAVGAHLHVPRKDFAYGVEFGLKMLITRHVIEETEKGLAIVKGERDLVAYYANSVAHLSPPRERDTGAP